MTDFNEWLDAYVDPDEPEEVRSLYIAVRDGVPIDAPWEISRKGEQIFIRCCDEEWLGLLSEKAISAFLREMNERYGHDMGIEAWADSELDIANDRS